MVMFLKNVKALREDREIKQSELCKILGVAQNTYSQYENGKIAWTDKSLITLARFYEVSVDYLLGLTEERTPYPNRIPSTSLSRDTVGTTRTDPDRPSHFPYLQRLRQEHHLTQAEVASILGIDPHSYSLFETGKQEIPIRYFRALSKFYGVSMDDLAERLEQD
jgi:transcriptional regulator with XRE-family HTH domain